MNKLVVGSLGVGALLAIALLPYVFPETFDPYAMQEAISTPPTWLGGLSFALGSDDLGRDMLSRLVCGASVSLAAGAAVVILAASLGIGAGLLAAGIGGTFDRLWMRFLELIMAFPAIFVAIVVVSFLGPSLKHAVLAVALVALPRFARLARALARSEMRKPYVDAARCHGAGQAHILWREVLPNCLGPMLATAALVFAEGILETAALGFLGLGAAAPTAEWGTMLADGRQFIESAPWLVILPGGCMAVTVLLFNLLADGLQEQLDPQIEV